MSKTIQPTDITLRKLNTHRKNWMQEQESILIQQKETNPPITDQFQKF